MYILMKNFLPILVTITLSHACKISPHRCHDIKSFNHRAANGCVRLRGNRQSVKRPAVLSRQGEMHTEEHLLMMKCAVNGAAFCCSAVLRRLKHNTVLHRIQPNRGDLFGVWLDFYFLFYHRLPLLSFQLGFLCLALCCATSYFSLSIVRSAASPCNPPNVVAATTTAQATSHEV